MAATPLKKRAEALAAERTRGQPHLLKPRVTISVAIEAKAPPTVPNQSKSSIILATNDVSFGVNRPSNYTKLIAPPPG